MYRQPGLLFAEQGPLHVSTVVFRISKAALAADPQWIATTGLLQLSEDFAKLPFFQTIVVEIAADLEAVNLEPFRSALRDSCSMGVRHRTCKTAHERAVHAAGDGVSLPTDETVIVSPFWYSKDFRSCWRQW